MSTSFYWTRWSRQRIGRRRALGLFGGTAAAAAFMAACGSDDDVQSGVTGPTTPTGATGATGAAGILGPAANTTHLAVKGGTKVEAATFNPLNFDANGDGGNVNVRNATDPTYRQFIAWDHGTVDNSPEGVVIGDTVDRWEIAADGLTYTFHLRPQKFDPRPPTSGRAASTEDVKWSMERFESTHAGRALIFNSAGPDGPIESVSFPDDATFVVRTAFPTSYLLGALATWLSPVYLMPVEAENGFDVRNEMRGTGPFMLTEYEPDVRRVYERMPNFWDDRYPFLDEVRYIFIPERAARQAQFENGSIWEYAPLNEEVLAIKQRRPRINVHPIDQFGSPGSGNSEFFMFSDLPDSIFRDARVRHAVSMLLDRDLIIETMWNVAPLEAAGIPMRSEWHGVVNARWGSPKWLDPRKGELGNASKYWEYNPAEAAQLLRAADAYGTVQQFTTYVSGDGGAGDAQGGQAIVHMLQADGHFERVDYRAIPLSTEFLPQYHFGKGQYEGIAFLTYGGYPDFGLYMWNQWSPSGRNAIRDEPISQSLQALMQRHRAEFNEEAKLELEKEWQLEVAEIMPSVPWPGMSYTFNLSWPWLGNGGLVKTWGWPTTYEGNAYYYWYDESKA